MLPCPAAATSTRSSKNRSSAARPTNGTPTSGGDTATHSKREWRGGIIARPRFKTTASGTGGGVGPVPTLGATPVVRDQRLRTRRARRQLWGFDTPRSWPSSTDTLRRVVQSLTGSSSVLPRWVPRRLGVPLSIRLKPARASISASSAISMARSMGKTRGGGGPRGHTPSPASAGPRTPARRGGASSVSASARVPTRRAPAASSPYWRPPSPRGTVSWRRRWPVSCCP
jgi:hypothetical protein